MSAEEAATLLAQLNAAWSRINQAWREYGAAYSKSSEAQAAQARWNRQLEDARLEWGQLYDAMVLRGCAPHAASGGGFTI